MVDKARSVIVLCLGNKVLREVVNEPTATSMWSKLESLYMAKSLRAETKRAIGYQKIRQFSDLVSSCRIYEEDTKAHYKIMNERKGKQEQSRGKPYSAPADKGKQRVNDENKPRKRDTPAEIVCFWCGEKGHKSNTCNRDVKRCFPLWQEETYNCGLQA